MSDIATQSQVVVTPAAAPPAVAPSLISPAVSKEPVRHAQPPQKVFLKTKVPTRAFAQATGATPAAVTATPVVAEEVTAEPAVEELAAVSPTGDADDSAADSAATAKPLGLGQAPLEEGELPAEAATPKIDETELTRRLAKLNRKEAKLQGRLGIASELEALVGPQFATRETVRTLVQRTQMLERGRQLAAEDPAAFIEQLYGIPRQHTADRTINSVIGETAKTPEQRAAEMQQRELALTKQRLDAYERQLQEAAQRQKLTSNDQQTRNYIEGTIAPLVKDASAYKFVLAEHGERSAQTVFDVQYSRLQKLRQEAVRQGLDPNAVKPPTAKQVADFLEGRYRERAAKSAALLGVSVKPKQPASTTGTEPPAAKRPAPPTRAPQPNPALLRGQKKPYTVREIR
jgi:hypothetical protein